MLLLCIWEEDARACLGGLLAGLMNYCVKNTGNRASPDGSAQCELLFVPLAAVLRCYIPVAQHRL